MVAAPAQQLARKKSRLVQRPITNPSQCSTWNCDELPIRYIAAFARLVLSVIGETAFNMVVRILSDICPCIMATADRLGLRPESIVINIDRFGNTTAGTIPLAMDTALQEGKLKKGSLVLLASVGAGFTVGATLLRWAY